MPQTLKPWLIMGLIFVLGMVTGGALMFGLEPFAKRPPGEDQMKKRLLMTLTRKLNLTTDQQTKIDPILTDASRQIQMVHRDEIGRVSVIMEMANSQIATILTPDQKIELEKMQKEEMRDFQGRMHGHGQNGPGGPGGGPMHGGPGGMPFSPQGGPPPEPSTNAPASATPTPAHY